MIGAITHAALWVLSLPWGYAILAALMACPIYAIAVSAVDRGYLPGGD